MLIILETSQAEALHHANLQVLRRAEEFARLYGGGALSHQSMLELLGFAQSNNHPPRTVFVSTPQQPNLLMDYWRRSVADVTVGQGGHAMDIRGVVVPDLIHTDE